MDVIHAETTLSNIMSFMDHDSASEMRRSERRMRDTMDSEELWRTPGESSGESSTQIPEKPFEPYHVSACLRKIILRESLKGWRCVSCRSISSIPIHPFYKTVVCKKCIRNKIGYRIMGQKAACKKYFIEPNDLGEISRIERSKGVFRVLEHQVKSVAERKLGKHVVRGRLDKRRRMAETIQSNRLWSYRRRLDLLTMYTKSALMRSSVRIDSELMDVHTILRIAGHYNLSDYITHDVLEFKINSRFSVERASVGLFDFASFLSNCRRNGILMDDYKSTCPHHEDFDAGIVFLEHCRGQMHFYEYISKYMKSIESLLSRSKSVLAHTVSMGDSFSRVSRKEVCEILFAEEGIPFIENHMIGEYIDYGVGDPVFMIREFRKMIFLYSNGYDHEVDYYVNTHRMPICRASVYAKRGILRETGGYPIMDRLFLDDRISCMYT